MAPTALVTGGTGCLGANIVAALLTRGYQVRAMRRPSSTLRALVGLDPELVVGDVLDPASLAGAMQGCSLVFHVAAIADYWRTTTARMYEVNVEGTRNVVEAAYTAGVQRLVYTSSSAALGVPRKDELLDETSVFNLPPHRFPYGHSKYMAEQVVQAATARGLDAVIVNPTGVIGARDVNFIGGSLLREVRRGLSWVAPPGGLNWVDAETAGEGHVLAAERGRTGVRYILGGENSSHREALEIVAQIVEGRRPVVTLPRQLMVVLAGLADAFNRIWPGTPLFNGQQARLSALNLYYDCSRAQQELGFPLIPLRVAVERADAWYRANGQL